MSRKYGRITAKDLKGLYEVNFRTWKIRFPYMSQDFIFAGTLEDAKKAAAEIARNTKWTYTPQIREISGTV